jgi:hypothetical protein
MSLFDEYFVDPCKYEMQDEGDDDDNADVASLASFVRGRTDADNIIMTDWLEDWQSNLEPALFGMLHHEGQVDPVSVQVERKPYTDENYQSSPIDKATKFKLIRGAAVAQRCTDALQKKITMNNNRVMGVNMPMQKTRPIADQLLYRSFTMQQGKTGELVTMYLPATIVFNDLENVPPSPPPLYPRLQTFSSTRPSAPFSLPIGYRTCVRSPQRGDQAISMCTKTHR